MDIVGMFLISRTSGILSYDMCVCVGYCVCTVQDSVCNLTSTGVGTAAEEVSIYRGVAVFPWLLWVTQCWWTV